MIGVKNSSRSHARRSVPIGSARIRQRRLWLCINARRRPMGREASGWTGEMWWLGSSNCDEIRHGWLRATRRRGIDQGAEVFGARLLMRWPHACTPASAFSTGSIRSKWPSLDSRSTCSLLRDVDGRISDGDDDIAGNGRQSRRWIERGSLTRGARQVQHQPDGLAAEQRTCWS
jgi:hypothetical protein